MFCRRGKARSSRVGVGECEMHVKARNRVRRVDLERTEGGWGPGEGGHGMGRVVGMRSVRSLIVLSTRQPRH